MNETTATEATGAVTGGCRTLLRLEGLTLFVGMTMLYAVWGGSWWVYAVLFLVPDVSFAAYLAGPRIGAVVYNAAHSYMAPMVLMTTGLGLASPLTLSIALIWLAHIGIDRALGYGLISAGSGRMRPTLERHDALFGACNPLHRHAALSRFIPGIHVLC
jgi:Domain of unknown function (DUF4260)